MKQKVVIKLTMCNPKKSSRKAMKIGATFSGVELVALKGAEKDELEVIGERIDTAELASSPRKKVCTADLRSVGQFQEPKKEVKTEEEKRPVVSCYGAHVYEIRDPAQN